MELRKIVKKVKTIATIVTGFAVTAPLAVFAAGPANMTFSQLQTNVSTTEDHIWQVVAVILTLAGLLLVASGLVNLKQHYHGTGQEKHMTKGIAKLAFGAAIFLVVPFTHVLVGGISGDTAGATYNSFTVNHPYNGGLEDGGAPNGPNN